MEISSQKGRRGEPGGGVGGVSRGKVREGEKRRSRMREEVDTRKGRGRVRGETLVPGDVSPHSRVVSLIAGRKMLGLV